LWQSYYYWGKLFAKNNKLIISIQKQIEDEKALEVVRIVD